MRLTLCTGLLAAAALVPAADGVDGTVGTGGPVLPGAPAAPGTLAVVPPPKPPTASASPSPPRTPPTPPTAFVPATRTPGDTTAPAAAAPPAPGTAHAVTGLVLAGAAGAAVLLLPRARGTTRAGDGRRGRRGRGSH
ncbi:hypothetical protein ACWCRF_08200 [Streptomyces sp. NPDC002405]|uniref:hypothetical protein n=1 Tax=unclassified Streptomyces TaxID=2593676 RepID=UPI00369CEA32